jgi:uncharacterized protein YprB with RNaseH-like and TPR domain
LASSLRARLSAIKQASPAARAPARVGGLVCLAGQERVPDALYSIPPEALRRIGWNGRIFDPERCLFLDTETTGLSHGAGTVAFLVGAGYIRRGVMTVEQFFMRDYSDEPDLLCRLKALMEDFDCVVTFNGRTFDMPLLETRFTMNRLRDHPELFNLDLLPPARRAWKLRIESCRLANIEKQILGIERENDLPGSEVPARYFEFLKTGDMELVNDIIRHNRQDIFSLAHLLSRLCEVYAQPEIQKNQLDLFSLGKALEKQGESGRARELYRLSAIPRKAGTISSLRAEGVAGQANSRLARLSIRAGDIDSAIATYEQMLLRAQMGVIPHIELAKIYEHRIKDISRALEHTRSALKKCDPGDMPALEKREARLLAKLANNAKNRKD